MRGGAMIGDTVGLGAAGGGLGAARSRICHVLHRDGGVRAVYLPGAVRPAARSGASGERGRQQQNLTIALLRSASVGNIP